MSAGALLRAGAAGGAAGSSDDAPADAAASTAAGVRAGPWVSKKRLAMAGLSGGHGSGCGSGGRNKLSPAEALAKDVQSADDMF